jgi:hypothetical protein
LVGQSLYEPLSHQKKIISRSFLNSGTLIVILHLVCVQGFPQK